MKTGEGFRRQVLNLLLRTRWAKEQSSDSVEEIARRLGVQPDVLVEARRLYGRAPRSETREFLLAMPQKVHADWIRVTQMNRLDSSLLLRGLIQALLLSGVPPKRLQKFWIYKGERLHVGKQQGQTWPWKAHTYISWGADRALTQIAERYQATKTALVRGHVCAYLEGKASKLVLVGVNNMYNDPTRYTELWVS